MKLNKQDIIKLLPHREPMLLIDELVSKSSIEISISGLKNKFSYCSNSVPIENPVFETLYPKSDKLSVVFDWTDVNKVLSV